MKSSMRRSRPYHPTGYVVEATNNAEWEMHHLAVQGRIPHRIRRADYSATIVAQQGDYVWLMARTPSISAGDYARYEKMIADMGYDTAKIRSAAAVALEAAP